MTTRTIDLPASRKQRRETAEDLVAGAARILVSKGRSWAEVSR